MTCRRRGNYIYRAPLAFQGEYSANIASAEFRTFDYLRGSFGGRWRLLIDDDIYVVEGPGYRVTEGYRLSAEFEIRATLAPKGAYNCFDIDGSRMTGPGRAAATYSVRTNADTLIFEVQNDPCPVRKLILERAWRLTTAK